MVYIGCTSVGLKKRFSKHVEASRRGAGHQLAKAMRLYGPKNFEITEISSSRDKKIAYELESFFVSMHKSILPNGYNMNTGGLNPKYCDFFCEKLKASLTERDVTWGKKVSISVKELWKNKEYRDRQVRQRHQKRGRYKSGIVREKLRKEIEIDKFKEDYHNFMHLTEIAEKYKISINTIYKIIKREKIKKRGYKCHSKMA